VLYLGSSFGYSRRFCKLFYAIAHELKKKKVSDEKYYLFKI